MHILSLDGASQHELPFQYAAGAGHSAIGQLPFLVGTVAGLPEPLDALVCASDLQGIEAPWLAKGTPRLLGQAVADEVALFLQLYGQAVPERCGIILAGDLFAYGAGKRAGVSGDVTPV